jgi:hypothetical protein
MLVAPTIIQSEQLNIKDSYNYGSNSSSKRLATILGFSADS